MAVDTGQLRSALLAGAYLPPLGSDPLVCEREKQRSTCTHMLQQLNEAAFDVNSVCVYASVYVDTRVVFSFNDLSADTWTPENHCICLTAVSIGIWYCIIHGILVTSK